MIPNSKIPKLRLLHYENSLKLSVIPQLKERERERELYKNENELRRKQTTYGQNKKSDRLMTNK
jgi:hypothetical protein